MAKGKPLPSMSTRSTLLKYFLVASIVVLTVFFLIPPEYPLEISRKIYGSTAYVGYTFVPKVIPSDFSDEELDKLPPSSFSYITMIDAGSSGCRAHVYRYGLLGNENGPLYVVPKHVSKKIKPGLSSFAKNPSAAGESLGGLIEFLKNEIPKAEWNNTPIWLKATAGLRMIDRDQSASILTSVRAFLSDKTKSPFLFRPSWAKVIPGSEEGAFGWIAVNYLYKVIGPKSVTGTDPYAVVEMGGASTQVTQVAPNLADAEALPSDYKFLFHINGRKYILYTHSYLGYGGEQAREAVNKAILTSKKTSDVNNTEDPCINTGYKRPATEPRKDVYEGPNVPNDIIGVASNNPMECSRLITDTLFPVNDQTCTSPAPHSFGCVFQPEFIKKTKNFLVFENFYYVASGVNLKPHNHPQNPTTSSLSIFPLKTTPQEYIDSSMDVCSPTWEKLQSEYPKDDQSKDFNVKLCFATTYAGSFLVNGIGLPVDKVITVQKEVAGSEIEWALGAAFKEANEFLIKEKQQHLRGIS